MRVLITNADDSRGVKRSSASVCLCVRVCPRDRTKTAETTITKLATGIVHHESWLYTHLILGQKVKSQGQRVKSVKTFISGDRVASVSYALYRVPIV